MNFFYRFSCFCLKLFFSVLYRHKTFGHELLPPGGCIIAPNHTSFYDPPLVAISCKEELNFLAKADLFKNRFLRFLITRLNAYPVTGTTHDLKLFKLIVKLLQEQKKIVIFPEGMRSNDGHLSSVKSGVAMLALRCQCPIVPVYIHGPFEIWPRNQRYPKFKGRTACVFGSPINISPYLNMEKKEAQEAISKDVHESIENLRLWYQNNQSKIL